jgi:hypothetical protein
MDFLSAGGDGVELVTGQLDRDSLRSRSMLEQRHQ